MSKGNSFQWEHPKALEYGDTIRQRVIGYDFIFELMVDLLKASSVDPTEIVVVGAGGGQELISLLPIYPKATYLAVDPSENMLKLAKKCLVERELEGDIQFFAEKLQHVPINRQVDVITCHLVLHFLPTKDEKIDLIKQMADRLKKGGYCFISSINVDMNSSQFEHMIEAWGEKMLRDGLTEKQWHKFKGELGDAVIPVSSAEIEKLFEDAGLKVLQKYYSAYCIEAYFLQKA